MNLPQPPPLNTLGVLNSTATDRSHLQLLSLFHFIYGGFHLLGLFGLLAHFLVFNTMLTSPEAFGVTSSSEQVPPEVLGYLRAFYVLGALLIIAAGSANIAAGLFLKRSCNRMFSVVISGINCLNIPLGTVLGVFTIIVLFRPSVIAGYEAAALQRPQ